MALSYFYQIDSSFKGMYYCFSLPPSGVRGPGRFLWEIIMSYRKRCAVKVSQRGDGGLKFYAGINSIFATIHFHPHHN